MKVVQSQMSLTGCPQVPHAGLACEGQALQSLHLTHAIFFPVCRVALMCCQMLMQVWCDLGTDCSDCGPYTYVLPRPSGSQAPERPQPVRLLVERGIEVT